MNLEDQVCSIQSAIKLAELRVEQKSLFWWHYLNEHCYSVRFITSKAETSGTKLYSAFTVPELGQLLPASCHFAKICDGRSGTKETGEWCARYLCNEYRSKKFIADNEADSRAKMLIYLIENDLIGEKNNER